jgi:alcohol sulfotransferase
LKPADPNNPQSFKVRRAKVGGYRDYFDDAETRQIDAITNESLSPVWGYERSSSVAMPRTPGA